MIVPQVKRASPRAWLTSTRMVLEGAQVLPEDVVSLL